MIGDTALLRNAISWMPPACMMVKGHSLIKYAFKEWVVRQAGNRASTPMRRQQIPTKRQWPFKLMYQIQLAIHISVFYFFLIFTWHLRLQTTLGIIAPLAP